MKFKNLQMFIKNTKELKVKLKVDDDNENQVFKIKKLKYIILLEESLEKYKYITR